MFALYTCASVCLFKSGATVATEFIGCLKRLSTFSTEVALQRRDTGRLLHALSLSVFFSRDSVLEEVLIGLRPCPQLGFLGSEDQPGVSSLEPKDDFIDFG